MWRVHYQLSSFLIKGCREREREREREEEEEEEEESRFHALYRCWFMEEGIHVKLFGIF